jgi:hypothetical protein
MVHANRSQGVNGPRGAYYQWPAAVPLSADGFFLREEIRDSRLQNACADVMKALHRAQKDDHRVFDGQDLNDAPWIDGFRGRMNCGIVA